MTVEVGKELSEEQIGELVRIDDMACEITEYPKYNSTKSLIYVYEYDIDNKRRFQSRIEKQFQHQRSTTGIVHKNEIRVSACIHTHIHTRSPPIQHLHTWLTK